MIETFTSHLRDIDLALFHIINGFCGRNVMFDHIASRLEGGHLKGLAFMSTFGMLWFQRSKTTLARQRETLAFSYFSPWFFRLSWLAPSLTASLPHTPNERARYRISGATIYVAAMRVVFGHCPRDQVPDFTRPRMPTIPHMRAAASYARWLKSSPEDDVSAVNPAQGRRTPGGGSIFARMLVRMHV
jgi:hypothetical protein